jgi:hypothetical protein
MDLGRACYSTNMQFDEAGLLVRGIKWFEAAPGAGYFPVQHLFGQGREWAEHQLEELGPGERWDSPHVYSKGATVPFLSGSGAFCGPQSWWEDGVPSDAPPVVITDGIPACCGQLTCMPWNDGFSPGIRSATNESSGMAWTTDSDIATNYSAFDPSNPNAFVAFAREVSVPCGMYLKTSAILELFSPPHTYTLALIGYNATTQIGRWQAPATAVEYPSQVWDFYSPLA